MQAEDLAHKLEGDWRTLAPSLPPVALFTTNPPDRATQGAAAVRARVH
jgi:hypothetical protein